MGRLVVAVRHRGGGRSSSGARSGLLGLSGPPMVAPVRPARGSKPTQLLAVDAIAVPRHLVDGQVRVELTEV